MRNRYLDLLRAAAIVRVIVYHLFGWPWLSILLPAMGIMFALAGSLTAASLDKRAAKKVVTSRLRRLLPPLWLLGLIAVPLMIAGGWAHEKGGDHVFNPTHLLFWIFPLGDPPGSQRGVDVWEPLWYIRAYVWFIVLSPVMYAVYKKLGWFTILLPIIGIAILDKTNFDLPFNAGDSAMWDFVTFGACWIAGFTHHDGRLRRANPPFLLFCSLVLGAMALYWQSEHQGDQGWDLNDVPESQALWSLAFVLFALQFKPDVSWLVRSKPLDKMVTLLNNRAVTIYLWHNIAIAAVFPLLTLVSLDDIGSGEDFVTLAGAFVLTFVAVIAFGWVEDVAAKRRPRLWPTSSASPRPVEKPDPAPETREPVLVGATVGSYDTAVLPALQGPAPASRELPRSWPPMQPSGPDLGASQAAHIGPSPVDGPANFAAGPQGFAAGAQFYASRSGVPGHGDLSYGYVSGNEGGARDSRGRAAGDSGVQQDSGDGWGSAEAAPDPDGSWDSQAGRHSADGDVPYAGRPASLGSTDAGPIDVTVEGSHGTVPWSGVTDRAAGQDGPPEWFSNRRNYDN